MASWQPTKQEPDPIRAALYDYLRSRASAVYFDSQSKPKRLGRSTVMMSNGEVLNVDLTIAPVDARMFGPRASVVFAVSGHAAETKTGYEVTGEVIIDRKSLAFLMIKADLTVVNAR